MSIKKLKRGFTLVELMIVVAIIGVLAALAVYGVQKYIANSKTAEARTTIGRIAKDAVAAFTRDKMHSDVLALEATGDITHALCKSAASPVPAAAADVAAKKYQSHPDEWGKQGDPEDTGWKCLKFSLQDPQYYQYNYVAATDNSEFTASAAGNLDGDATPSLFELKAALDEDTQSLRLAPTIAETDPEE